MYSIGKRKKHDINFEEDKFTIQEKFLPNLLLYGLVVTEGYIHVHIAIVTVHPKLHNKMTAIAIFTNILWCNLNQHFVV